MNLLRQLWEESKGAKTVALRYPPEPPNTDEATAIMWGGDTYHYLALRDTDCDKWEVTGDEEHRDWDELMAYASEDGFNPQLILDSVRVIDLPGGSS